MCQTIPLSSNENITISQCAQCQIVYVWFNNLMLSLTTEKFKSFQKAMRGVDFNRIYMDFPDGIERAIIGTPNPEVAFVVTEEDLSMLNDTMAEAAYMIEIYTLMV